jgi:hypothetical protein
MHVRGDYSLSFMERLDTPVTIVPSGKGGETDALILRLHSVIDVDVLWNALQYIIRRAMLASFICTRAAARLRRLAPLQMPKASNTGSNGADSDPRIH